MLILFSKDSKILALNHMVFIKDLLHRCPSYGCQTFVTFCYKFSLAKKRKRRNKTHIIKTMIYVILVSLHTSWVHEKFRLLNFWIEKLVNTISFYIGLCKHGKTIISYYQTWVSKARGAMFVCCERLCIPLILSSLCNVTKVFFINLAV